MGDVPNLKKILQFRQNSLMYFFKGFRYRYKEDQQLLSIHSVENPIFIEDEFFTACAERQGLD